MLRTLLTLLAASTLLTAPAPAQSDWTNYGGGPGRNGLTDRFGPTSSSELWSNGADFSVIAWHPFLWQELVITVREAGFPGAQANDAIVAYHRETGLEVWRTTLPYGGDSGAEWIAWIGGVADGRVIASRSDNGRKLPLQALDASTGAPLWTSQIATFAWAHDGLVFLDDGDFIVGDRESLTRVDGSDGTTVWSIARSCSVSGNCGAARFADAVYIDEAAPGGQVLTRVDANTGARLYSSPAMPGFTCQNQPFLSPDGQVVYYARSQNNPTTDFLYAFHDDGTQFTEVWNRPIRWTTRHEHGVAADGSIYTFLPGDEFVRLDPATGNVLNTAGILAPIGTNLSPQTAVDAAGRVYVSNGWASSPASDGRVWAFGPDLGAPLFTLFLDRQNAGGPAIGGQGELVIADRSAVRVLRLPGPQASATPRFGSGVNPVAFDAVNPPEVYGEFEAQVAVDASTALTVVLVSIAPLAVPIPFEGGELLVALPSPFPIQSEPLSSGGLHALAIPGDPALLGAFLTSQGARVQLNGPVPSLQLGNALDLILGF
ncbi:PQQ-binding-like beta-propeller repeat protein [Engelhardtia mirabilis]|uniref:Pyrrolo-quinoline quinone repeat domain-containing protein n=1 Tax=Engelhardtia mirabilis TaxID=2528011 RepID=A0A518BME6_9BACT|nr:hypothetical protein Pla133_32100 [Planctomycetes bacterium Pla133]QDV02442.1 hypothetical protein Pla86_32090 [Planctomycetes bacterium Pla86]